MPLGLALLSAAFPAERRRGAMAILSSVTGLSVLCGPLVGGLAIEAAGTTWIALIANPHLPYGRMVVPLVVAGAGFAIAIPSIQGAVMGAVAPESIGHAPGTLSTVRQLGGVFGVAVAAAAFAGAGGYGSADAFSDGFVAAIGTCAGLSLLGALAGFALPARSGRFASASQDGNRSGAERQIGIPNSLRSNGRKRTCAGSHSAPLRRPLSSSAPPLPSARSSAASPTPTPAREAR